LRQRVGAPRCVCRRAVVVTNADARKAPARGRTLTSPAKSLLLVPRSARSTTIYTCTSRPCSPAEPVRSATAFPQALEKYSMKTGIGSHQTQPVDSRRRKSTTPDPRSPTPPPAGSTPLTPAAQPFSLTQDSHEKQATHDNTSISRLLALLPIAIAKGLPTAPGRSFIQTAGLQMHTKILHTWTSGHLDPPQRRSVH
jgi:hypothetical protein